jgi:hypothetical protein
MLSNDNTERRNRRLESHADCKIFVDLATAWFPEIAKRDPRHALLAETYGFYVVPGDREGGDGGRLLEVSYGQRPVERTAGASQSDQKGNSPPPRTRFVTEAGASLRYQRTDQGSVLCLLEPARSPGFERPESLIVLAHIKEPRLLTGKPILERHWRNFISYFEYSGVDGDPEFLDRLRVRWLLFTRPVIIDGKVQPRRIVRAGGEILKWAITIGLSAAILAAVVRLAG